ncbi:MAG: thioether cross-link-forming SCIFF peptide maturase [Clostridiales bacterium]|nr:thioether cross-link-forming SCIFF peptide maturase [Clostridiales bacterium]
MVHRFSKKDVNILVDSASGAVHLADKAAYDLCGVLSPPLPKDCPESARKKLSEHYSDEEILEAYQELYSLYKAGELFTSDYDGAETKMSLSGAPVKALCLNVSHDCNLRCEYCFAKTGDFGTGRRIMDFDTAKKAVDFVIKHSGKRRNIEIDFFGGEPLMAFDTVKRTVDYAKGLEEKHNKNFRFTITTNGLLLNDEITEYINREMSNVVLSLDGRKEINDHVRKTIVGTGCYDAIVPKMKRLVRLRDNKKDYYVRGTFTKNNPDFCEDIKEMLDCGFTNLSLEPVVLKKENPLSITKEDLSRVFEEYDRLCDLILEREKEGQNFEFFHFMIDLEQGPCILKRLRGCGAGFEYVAVTPEGDIYPCHQFVGMDEFILGNLNDGTFDVSLSDRFAAINFYTRKDCLNCWAKYYCGGGCSAANQSMNNDLLQPYELGCELERKRVECAIYLKARRMLDLQTDSN